MKIIRHTSIRLGCIPKGFPVTVTAFDNLGTFILRTDSAPNAYTGEEITTNELKLVNGRIFNSKEVIEHV